MLGTVEKNPSSRECVELHCEGCPQAVAYKQKKREIFWEMSASYQRRSIVHTLIR